MPFYIRKSIKAGPFRFNLSNSGIGVSVGVKGLRIGTGPRGHYVHAGRGGFYYRASLGNAHKPTGVRNYTPIAPPLPRTVEEGRVTMVTVQSSDVSEMREATLIDLIDEINKKHSQISLGAVAAIAPFLLGTVILFQSISSNQSFAAAAGLLLLAASLPGWALGAWFDSYKKTTVLLYDLQSAAQDSYRKVVDSFDAMASCHGKWHIVAGGAVKDLTTWKRNAGAAHLINRKPASLNYVLPKVLRSNITPPTISVRNHTFYFMPEFMLVKQGRRFGAVSYENLRIRVETSRFIEETRPPADAQIVGSTWMHPNKSGGPDRRFRNNRQLPICLYEVMHLSSISGVNELIEFSRTGILQKFSDALLELPQRQMTPEETSVFLLDNEAKSTHTEVLATPPPRKYSRTRWAILGGLFALICGSVAGIGLALQNGDFFPPKQTLDSSNTSPPKSAQVLSTTATSTGQSEVPAATPSANTSVRPTVTLKRSANVRSGPSISSKIIRVAHSADRLNVFGQTNGWTQVGIDKPIGWIADSLLTK